ncbi:MAG: CDP-glucose 4,6-dehydratase [Oscillospiraceae bacterium]|nr:CDP-glucose 4,6-dehydratase [Oscillospiraceae bacterium]
MNGFDLRFYKGRRVFVTGHSGFKGSWLCRLLLNAGAEVTGYALEAGKPSLFDAADISSHIVSVTGDIRDIESLRRAFDEAKPEIVFHLAAQPIVRESYRNPAYTYETNVMGTVNILECVRKNGSARSFLNVTTDKVYMNSGKESGYTENEVLNGYDPYSNSKSCSELVTNTYKNCFLDGLGVRVSTARGGNVIGGGDFGTDRIVPDCVRAVSEGGKILVRNPDSVRPYQHVLDALSAYLMIAAGQYGNSGLAGCYNVAPDERGCITTGELAGLFCKYWGGDAAWETCEESNAPEEVNFLKLDCSKLKAAFGWRPVWDIERSVEETCRFTKVMLNGGDVPREMDREIGEFFKNVPK